MLDKEVKIKIRQDGAKKTKDEIKNLAGDAVKSFEKIKDSVDLLSGKFQEIIGALQPVYDLLIQSNEELNQNILKQQTFLAQGTQIFDEYGQAITNVSDKIDSTRGKIKEALIGVQRDTDELVGVTTSQVNEAFGIVVQQSGKIAGQFTDEFADDTLAAARKLTKGVVAAIGTLQLGTDQVRQEFNALISGDLNNPDATLAATLNINKEDFEKARAQGRLIDFLNEKLEVFEVANKKASKSIEGISSNLVSFVENVGRAAGEPLFAPIVEGLDSIQQKVIPLTDSLSKTFGSFSSAVAPAFNRILQLIVQVGEEIVKLAVEVFGQLFGNTQDVADQTNGLAAVFEILLLGLRETIAAAREITRVFGEMGSGFKPLGTFIQETLKGLGLFSDALNQVGQDLQKLTRGQSNAEALQNSFKAAVENTSVVLGRNRDRYKELLEIKKKAEEAGGLKNLSKEEQKRFNTLRGLIKLGEQEVAVLKKNLEEATGVSPDEKAVKAGFDKIIGSVEQSYEDFKKETQEALDVNASEINIAPLEIKDKQELISAFQSEVDGLLLSISKDASGDESVFATITNDVIGLITSLEGLKGNTKEALSQLKSIRDNTKVTKDTRIAAQKAITDIINKEGKERVEAVKTEISEIDRLTAQGQISSGEAAIRKIENEGKTIAIELETARKNLNEAIAAKDQTAAKELENTIKELENKAKSIPFEIAEQRSENALKAFERQIDGANRKLDRLQSQRTLDLAKLQENRLLTSSEIAERQTQIESDAAAEQVKIARQRVAELAKIEDPATQEAKRDLAIQREEAQTALIQATQARVEANIAAENAERDRILGLLELSKETSALETEVRLTELEKQRVNADQIARARIDSERQTLEASREISVQRLALAKGEEEILEARKALNDVDQQLLQNSNKLLEFSIQLAQTDAARASLITREVIAQSQELLSKRQLTEEEFTRISIEQAENRLQAQLKAENDILAILESRGASEGEIIGQREKILDLTEELKNKETERSDLERSVREKTLALEQTLAERRLILEEGVQGQVRRLSEETAEFQARQALERISQQERQLANQIALTQEFDDEGLEKQNKLAELENQRLQLANQRVQLERDVTDSTLNKQIAQAERLLRLDERRNQNNIKAAQNTQKFEELRVRSLERQGQQLKLQSDLASAIRQKRLAELNIANDLLASSIQYKQQLEGAGALEAQAIRDVLAQRGEAASLTQSDILEQQRLRDRIARAEFQSRKSEIELKNQSLSIEEKIAEIARQRQVAEAKAAVRSLEIEKQKLLIEKQKLALLPDEERIPQERILNEAISLQDQAIGLGQQSVDDAQKQAALESRAASIRQQIAETENQTALKQAKSALEQSLAQNKIEAARALDQINQSKTKSTETPSPAPAPGGQVERNIINNFNFANSAGARSTVRALGI